MDRIKLNDLIVADPAICHGQPTFAGTRIMVWQILELLEEGQTEQEIFTALPSLPKGAISAALGYAKEKVKETSYVPFVPQKTEEDRLYSR